MVIEEILNRHPAIEVIDYRKDKVKPTGKWAFDENVAKCFEDMLRRSIPQIDVMRKAVTDLAVRYMKPNSDVLDLGCSRGDAISPLLSHASASTHFYGLEVSEAMRNEARHRFQLVDDQVKILEFDLRNSMENLHVSPSVVLSILTMQFVPIEYRQASILDVYKKLRPGGAFIMVEKVLGSCAQIDSDLVSLYYAGKRENGYSQEDIDRKRLSLEGVLVPVTSQWNEDMLRSAGFKQVDCFWRFLNFSGWIALK